MKLIKKALLVILVMQSFATIAHAKREAFLNKTVQNGYSIESIIHCGKSVAKNEKDSILFDGTTNLLSGWSHAIQTNGLKLNSTKYTGKVVEDASCNNVTTYQNILAKKYANWSNQHVNGIEPKFISGGIRLSELEGIVLEFKVSSDGSSIPTKVALKNLYDTFLDSNQLNRLDNNKINFGITIFETDFDNQSTASFNANIFLELDQAIYYDQWVRVKIPVSSLNYFTEKNYDETVINPENFKDTVIIGLRINPETQFGKVVRHSTNDTFETNPPPEAFKEMNVAFKKIALILK